MMTAHWKVLTPSQFEHERRALDFVRAGLPDHEPYRAWANFEFTASDGALYEVDLLVLAKLGFWLVEIKGRPGRLEGDAATWTWTTPEGRRLTDDNPRLLANRKAKALKSLLLAQPALKGHKLPFLDEVVFLSAPELDCQLSPAGMSHVCLVDRGDDHPLGPRPGILAALINRQLPGVEAVCRTEIDAKLARALSRAMEQAGIRRSQKERRAGDYFLGELLADGPTYQDRVATHAAIEGVKRRARQYLVARATNEEQRPHVQRAAEREFRLLQSLDHPNILRVFDFKVHDFGPVLLFEHAPDAVRLDHYLTEKTDRIGPDLRLSILRQLADAVRHAHGRRIIHRALAPQSILVFNPDSPWWQTSLSAEPAGRPGGLPPQSQVPTMKVFNWQVGVRAAETASGGTTHVTDLIEDQSRVYLAPEAHFSPRDVTQAADVFSLGAIAFHLFAGRPPAPDPLQLVHLLREQNGLDLAAVLDGAGPRLCEMIRSATHPEVSSRTQSAEEFLLWLDEVEEEMTAPDGPPPIDPTQARRGDTLPGGYTVERVLGQGATGVALLAEIDGEQVVLKVARTPDDNQRLQDEADVLRRLHSEYIVRLRGVTEIGGRLVLVLDKAGDETLAERLHEHGPLSLEYLERFGDNLLQALVTLENAGVSHRDVKPHNIAVRIGKGHAHLVLFDFSLARAPVDNIYVGTPAYLDPFLKSRRPAQWEPSAERYAAAVTLYEAALGENVLPRWGDGSDPAAVSGAELQLAVESFDQAVREGLTAFFRKALHRQIRSRFHNAEEMLRAWRSIFLQAEGRTVRTTEGDEVSVEVRLEDVRPDTSVEMLGLSTRARNALTRVNVTNVRELLAYPPREVRFMPNVGNKTRREILDLVGRLRERFPDVTATAAPPAVSEDVAVLGLAALRERLIGGEPVGPRRKGDSERRVRLALLGLKPAEQGLYWPSQADVAARLAVSRQRVSQALNTDRRRWERDSAVRALAEQVVEQVRHSSGVMAARELIDFLVASRGFDYADPAHARRLAAALLRIVYEAEQVRAEPRLHLTRTGEAFILAVTSELAEHALRLAQTADAIAAEDPLPSAARTFQRLYDVPAPQAPPDCAALTSERLLRLAVAGSGGAALSPRQEIYPRGMAAERALRLGLGALTGLAPGDAITVEEVRQRITARYPEALPLPDHPELEGLLKSAGLDLFWDAATNCYRRPGARLPISSSGASSLPSRLATVAGARRPKDNAEAADAVNFEERLESALRHWQFLVLSVRPALLSRCEAELLTRFPTLQRVSLDALFLKHLRALAGQEGIDWPVVLDADRVPGSEDWQYLQVLVRRAVPLIRDDLLASGRPVLLVHPGLLTRYSQMSVIEQVRDQIGQRGKCPGLWLLVPGDEQQTLPTLDGQAVPLLGAGQHVAVPLPWLRNAHRAAVG
jgi:serine/threonine protein kinase